MNHKPKYPSIYKKVKKILDEPVKAKLIVKPKLNTKKEKQKAKIMEKLINYQFDTDFEYQDPLQLYEVTFNHIYFQSGFNLAGDDKYPQRHGCLRSGYFCLSNLLDYPLDLIDYLNIKIKKLKKQ